MKRFFITVMAAAALLALYAEKTHSQNSGPGAQSNRQSDRPVQDRQVMLKLQGIQTMPELNQWSTYYYLCPRPDLTVRAVLFCEKSGILDRATAQAPMLALYSQIFASNPKQLTVWIKELSPLSAAHKRLIWQALWQTNTAESWKAANIFAEQFPANNRPPVLSQSSPKPEPFEKMQLSPAVLDMLWSSFLITGDERFVERIISALAEFGDGKKQHSMTAFTAQWSLISNARNHQRVMSICKAAGAKHPECKAQLDDVIARASAPAKH